MTIRSAKRIAAFLWLLIVLACLTGCREQNDASEESFTEKFTKGPVTVWLHISDDEMTIADLLTLTIETTAAEGYQVSLPQIDTEFGDFEVVDTPPEPQQRLGKEDQLIFSYEYTLEPVMTGTASIPELTFTFQQPDTDQTEPVVYELQTKRIDIRVLSLLTGDPNEAKLAEIRDIVDIRSWTTLWISGLAILLLVVTGVLLIWRRIRRSKQKVRILKPAHDIALQRLRRLEAEELVEKGRLKEFYERISNILRHYIEDRFNLRAPERTTEEFLFELQRDNQLSSVDKESLQEFLTHCDLVKFAKHQPTADQIKTTFSLAESFIMKTKSMESMIDVTDSHEEAA